VRIDDVESCRSDLGNDFLTPNGINYVVGIIASFIGKPLGLFSASIITAKRMRLASPRQVHEQEEPPRSSSTGITLSYVVS